MAQLLFYINKCIILQIKQMYDFKVSKSSEAMQSFAWETVK